MEEKCEFDDSKIIRKLEEVLRKLRDLEQKLDGVAYEVHQIKSNQ